MKKRLFACLIALSFVFVLFSTLPAFAVNCGETNEFHGDIYAYKITWTSSGAGAYSCTTTGDINGFIYQFLTVPGGGAAAPDPNYDISVTNTVSGQDIDGGSLDNRHTSTSQTAFPTFGGSPSTPANFGKLDIAVTNAGAANTGTLYIFVLK